MIEWSYTEWMIVNNYNLLSLIKNLKIIKKDPNYKILSRQFFINNITPEWYFKNLKKKPVDGTNYKSQTKNIWTVTTNNFLFLNRNWLLVNRLTSTRTIVSFEGSY